MVDLNNWAQSFGGTNFGGIILNQAKYLLSTWRQGCLKKEWEETYRALEGLSSSSLCIYSYTLVMCWKSGTVSFWIGPRETRCLKVRYLNI